MLIDKNIFSATKKMHHKETTSWKITLHINKSKTIFGALLFKFLWTHTPKKQWNSLLLKLQLSVFAVGEVCIKNLARSLAVTTCTRIFFKKVNKANQMHGAKKVLKSVFWVKVLRKLPIKIYGQNPCVTAVKSIIMFLSWINETLLPSFTNARTVDIAVITVCSW